MLTLQQIHEEIEATAAKLEELVDQVAEAGDTAAQAEATFRAEFAKARLRARVTADAEHRRITTDVATDLATEATADARLGHLIATNNLTAMREALKARLARLDSLRTLAASYRGAGG